MRMSVPFLAVFVLGLPAHGTQWTDPSFEEMVQTSDLIALVEVVEGGKFYCQARCLKVLKGKDPGGVFPMGGFNNENWPDHGIEVESMRKGDRLLAFLRQGEEREEPGSGDEGEKRPPKGTEVWYAPTPSTGDFRVILGKLHDRYHDREAAEAVRFIGGKPTPEEEKLLAIMDRDRL